MPVHILATPMTHMGGESQGILLDPQADTIECALHEIL